MTYIFRPGITDLRSDARVYQPFSGGAFVGAYDAIPDLEHIYEPARRTLSAYVGDLVLLRRASDNAELAFTYISDANPDLNVAAITAWAGGASYVKTVYDQVGSDDLTNAVPAEQPLFTAAAQNGHAGMTGDGVDDKLLLSTASWTGDQALTVFSLSYPTAYGFVAGNEAVWSIGKRNAVNGDTIAFAYETNADDAMRLYGGNALFPNTALNNWYLHMHRYAGGAAAWSCRKNGADIAPSSSTGLALNLGNGTAMFEIINAAGNEFTGVVPSLIICDAALASADYLALETAINAYWNIY